VKQGNFKPKSDVEEYLNSEVNITIFNELNEDENLKLLFEKLEYFNLLYEQLEIVIVNKDKPLSVTKHLLSLDLEEIKIYYMLGNLEVLICELPKDSQILCCLDFIEKESNELGEKLFPTSKIDQHTPSMIYDFRNVKKHLGTLPDDKTKIKYLVNIKTEYLQNTPGYLRTGQSFGNNCELEISKIKLLSSMDELDIDENIRNGFDQFSTSQLVLIFYYFFKSNGLIPRDTIKIAPIARFIHLIIDEEFKSIPNSDIYDKLRKVPNFKNDRGLIDDLMVIRPLFQKVGLKSIVKMIDEESKIARAEIRNKK